MAASVACLIEPFFPVAIRPCDGSQVCGIILSSDTFLPVVAADEAFGDGHLPVQGLGTVGEGMDGLGRGGGRQESDHQP